MQQRILFSFLVCVFSSVCFTIPVEDYTLFLAVQRNDSQVVDRILTESPDLLYVIDIAGRDIRNIASECNSHEVSQVIENHAYWQDFESVYGQ